MDESKVILAKPLSKAAPNQYTVPDLDEWSKELDYMIDVMLHRASSPVDDALTGPMMVADAYYARAAEMTYYIQKLERANVISRGHPLVKFRTGELRTFSDMAKRRVETGSRLISAARLKFDQQLRGMEVA